MLIVNADDWGMNKKATDTILKLYKMGCITSATAMVFMKDTERSANLAISNRINTGLHLNFTMKYETTGTNKLSKLFDYQMQIAGFLLKNKYYRLIYNPFLRKQFDYVFKAQFEEYLRVFDKPPTHIDGHRHMHLCMNVILDKLIPTGCKIRRNFSFSSEDGVGFINRFSRKVVDSLLMRNYKSTDYFFSLAPIDKGRIRKIIEKAKKLNVELMVHPVRSEEYEYLTKSDYKELIEKVQKGTYSIL